MKKNLNTLVGYAHFAAIALIALLAACSGNDSTAEVPAQQTGQETEAVEYTVSIPATISDTDDTRAVSLNGETGGMDATFQTTDGIFVYNVSYECFAMSSPNQYALLHPDQDGATANLNGTLTFMKNNGFVPLVNSDILRLIYGITYTSGGSASVVNLRYTGQTGTLDGLSSYDYATSDVSIVSKEGSSTKGYTLTTSNADFQNEQTMFRLTFTNLYPGDHMASVTIHSAKDKLCTEYNPATGTASHGDLTITLNDAARTANGEGVVYAALRFDDLADGEQDDITFSVTGTSGNIYTATRKTPKGGFQPGNYYNAKLALTRSKTIYLSGLTNDYTAQDGDILTGFFSGTPCKISIADGATVTLNEVNIENSSSESIDCAGITCLGDATIILEKDNNVEAYGNNRPGIEVPKFNTLTIRGSGKLTAAGGENGAGIGSGYKKTSGSIVIEGGDITASGQNAAPGIGGHSCGDITITGGNIRAEAGADGGAGIGCGRTISQWDDYPALCGNITITGGSIYAKGHNGAGIGTGKEGFCGDITINAPATGVAKGEDGYDIGACDNGYCLGTISVEEGTVSGSVAPNPATCTFCVNFRAWQLHDFSFTSAPSIVVTIKSISRTYTVDGNFTDGSTVTMKLPVGEFDLKLEAPNASYTCEKYGGIFIDCNSAFRGEKAGVTIVRNTVNDLGTITLKYDGAQGEEGQAPL